MCEVYYVEDDTAIAQSVKEYLESQNCRVTILSTIVDTKQMIWKHTPDIILVDWNLPDGEGNILCITRAANICGSKQFIMHFYDI